jgi:hypothetical protein
MRRTGWIHNGVLLLAGLVLAVLLLEGLFRLVPTSFMDYRSNLRYVPDGVVGIKLKPDQKECATSMCYKICPVAVNSLGFRDREPTEARYDIAVLGDSYMEAAQVPEGLYLARLTEKILNVNVISSAISGYGTIHQFYCYRQYMAKYRPSVVLLFFSGNDVADNCCTTSTMKGTLCADMNGQGEIATSPSDGRLIEFKERVRTWCRSCYGVSKLWYTLKPALTRSGEKTSGVAPRPASEGSPAGPVPAEDYASKSWRITEYYLRQLNDEVNKNGGTLVVVPVFTPDDAFRNHFTAIASRSGIRLLLIDGILSRYRTEFNLPNPYFGYRCDGHWNPLTHFLAANAVARYLLRENLIHAGDRDRMLAAVGANLSLGPRSILGSEAYAQIFGGGVYRGASNIPEIMARTPLR